MTTFVRYRKLLAAFGTTTGQDGTPVGRLHAGTETVFVATLAVGGLKSAFHGVIRYRRVAKIQLLPFNPTPTITFAPMMPPHQPEALYTVGLDPERPRHLLVEVQWTVDGDQTRFRLPQWRPGRYEQSWFARNLVGMSAHRADGQPLHVIKTQASEWLVHHPGSTTLVLRYRYFANQPDAGACWADPDLMYVNPVHCLVYREHALDIPCRLYIRTHDLNSSAGAVAVAIALDGDAAQGYTAVDYHQLVDSPWMASSKLHRLDWTSEGVRFVLWTHGVPKPDATMQAQILRQWEAMARVQIQTLGQFPQEEFQFMLLGLPNAFYHGVEHARCTVLALGPAQDIWHHLYKELLGVASHELFHAWNIKSFRPLGMEKYRYEGLMYSPLGYVYEGFTTYYGDLFLARCGCFGVDEYLDEVNAYLLRHSENYGRFNHGLLESSTDTWVDGYSQTQSAPHRRVSIYAEGMLQALLLDLTLRTITADREHPLTLDDLIRHLWQRYLQHPHGSGYDQSTLIHWLQEHVEAPAAYGDWSRYFRIHYQEPHSVEESLRILLPSVGCRLVSEASEDAVKSLWGLQMNWNQAEPKVEHCVAGSPAALAGLGPGDRWLTYRMVTDATQPDELESPGLQAQTEELRQTLMEETKIQIHWITPLGHQHSAVVQAQKNVRYYDQHRIERDLSASPKAQEALTHWLGITTA